MSPRVEGFEVHRCLGEGAFGAVYLARETEGLKRRVALKLFHSADSAAYAQELRMTQAVEAVRSAGRVTELLQALGSGTSQGRGWISLEHLEAGSLHDVVGREGPLPPARAVAACADAARALAALHTAGLFHRDVKPGNLLLGSDGRVRLGDFGLSRRLSGSLSAAGSPAFAAPEVIADDLRDGRRADVYSLGATLCYLLTGAMIYPGRPDVFALEARGVPADLQRLLVAATAFEPDTRPPDAGAFLARLEAAKLDGAPPAEGGAAWSRGGAAAPATAREAAPARGRKALVAGALALAFLIPAGVALAFGPGHEGGARAVGGPSAPPGQRLRASVPGIDWLWAVPAVHDLDGDGVRDLLLNANGFTGGVALALSGRDGRELWRSTLTTNPWAHPRLVLAPGGARLALGTLERGQASLSYLDPQTGRALSATALGRADRAPLTAFPGQGDTLLCVSDAHLARELPATLSAISLRGGLSWQVTADRVSPGAELEAYAVTASAVDADGDGAREAALWEVGAELIACDPRTGGEAWRLRRTLEACERRMRWTWDHDGQVVGAWNDRGVAELAACSSRGAEAWRRRLPGYRVTDVRWLALEERQPRALVVAATGPRGGELLCLDEAGETLRRYSSESEVLEQPHVLKAGGRRWVVVGGLNPASAALLAPEDLSPVWTRAFPGSHTACPADLDGDGEDELILLDRRGKTVEVLTAPVPR